MNKLKAKIFQMTAKYTKYIFLFKSENKTNICVQR